jgi:hypothetical protein
LTVQWTVTFIRPYLERFLIYTGDQAEIRRIQELERRLLTGTDFQQLLESILAALCDYLRVDTAFVASLGKGGPKLEYAIGLQDERSRELIHSPELAAVAKANGKNKDGNNTPPTLEQRGDKYLWNNYWLVPLHYASPESASEPMLMGILGVAAPRGSILDEEHETAVRTLATRIAEVLDDRRLQAEVFAALEGLLPDITQIQQLRAEARYASIETLTQPAEEVLRAPNYITLVKDALKHYWGGPNLTDSTLMELSIVREALAENEGNPQRAMRAVLQRAIERLKPDGKRNLTTTEWILYNILEMRFIQGRKVRDVAMRLAMSEADLYRKQRVAIETVARMMAEMERASSLLETEPVETTDPLGNVSN